jgi:predicted DNA-binding transcriptional regulator AlpA
MIKKNPASQSDLFSAPAPQEALAASPVPDRTDGALNELCTPDRTTSVSVPLTNERYLSDVEVAKRFSVSRPTIWRWCKTNPSFPQPRKVTEGTTRWLLSELLAFDAVLNQRQAPKGAPSNASPAALANESRRVGR